jgi:hypothetical protein
MSSFPFMALPFDCRESIYKISEPHIIIDLAYPENIQKRFEPDWDPKRSINPMLGLSTKIDQEIQSYYFNLGNPCCPPFAPDKTTFQLYTKRYRLHQINVENFLEHNKRNVFGVWHLELIIDNFKGGAYGVDLSDLGQFPNLRTAEIITRYGEREMFTEQCKDELDAEMKGLVKVYFKESDAWKQVSVERRPRWTLERRTLL